MFFYHSSFLWVGSSRLRRKYVGIERSRAAGQVRKRGGLSYFAQNKYAVFGQFLLWGSDFINTWFSKERLQFSKNYDYMTTVESRPRVHRRFVFIQLNQSTPTTHLLQFSWIKSGAYFLDTREIRQTRREMLVKGSSPRLAFYYK